MPIVGDNEIFPDTIQNSSGTTHRRVDRTAKLASGVDVWDSIARLKAVLEKIPSGARDPALDPELIGFNATGPTLAMRPYTHTDYYWEAYIDANSAITDTVGGAG
jgi:small conductance mechanosensitive channel